MGEGRWFWTSRSYGALVVAATALYYLLPARVKGRREGGWSWFRKRMSAIDMTIQPKGPVVWLHGVSAGEAKVASLIADALKRSDPSLFCVVTTSTATGLAALQHMAGPDRVGVMPPDAPQLQRRLAATLRPAVAVLCESDFWPGYFAALRAMGVPVIIANARLSDRSASRFGTMPWLVDCTFGNASRIFVQDKDMARRFAACIGARTPLRISGNLKLATMERADVGKGPRDAVTFASLHDSELATLAEPLAAIAAALPESRIFVAPRHPGEAAARSVTKLLSGRIETIDPDAGLPKRPGIFLVNRMGVLPQLYAQSRVAVVCGSFAPVGGHDVAEPMHYGAVPVFGPHCFRQRSLVDVFGRAGIAQAVTPERLLDEVTALMADAGERSMRLAAFGLLSQQATDGLAETVSAIRAGCASEGATDGGDQQYQSGVGI